jgi:transposase
MLTIGCDLGDRVSHLCAIDAEGEVAWRERVKTTRDDVVAFFAKRPRARIILEVGTHSPWMSALLGDLGHEVIVANPRQVKLISESTSKRDIADAEVLARLGRVDPKLLAPIRHRRLAARRDLVLIRSRAQLVELRTSLVNHLRGTVKAFGYRLPKSTSEKLAKHAEEFIPDELRQFLLPAAKALASISEQIKALDQLIESVTRERYPTASRLAEVPSVGPVTALTFVLSIDDPSRFKRSRQVGAYLGLRPAQSQSGDSDPQLGITHTGDVYLRQLLVTCAHHLLSRNGKDSDLRRWGLALSARGGKNGKRRALCAVARRLAVLLHRLWVSDETYVPLRQGQAA